MTDLLVVSHQSVGFQNTPIFVNDKHDDVVRDIRRGRKLSY